MVTCSGAECYLLTVYLSPVDAKEAPILNSPRCKTSANASGTAYGNSATTRAGRRKSLPTGRAYTARTSGRSRRGEQNLSLVNIERLAATLGVSLAELFTPFGESPPRRHESATTWFSITLLPRSTPPREQDDRSPTSNEVRGIARRSGVGG